MNRVITKHLLKSCFKKKKITGDDAKKKKSNAVSLTNTIEKSPLIHNQIDLIKFVESCRYNTGR